MQDEEERRRKEHEQRGIVLDSFIKSLFLDSKFTSHDIDILMDNVFRFPLHEHKTRVLLWLPKTFPVAFSIDTNSPIYPKLIGNFSVLDIPDTSIEFEFDLLDVAIGYAVQRVSQTRIPELELRICREKFIEHMVTRRQWADGIH